MNESICGNCIHFHRVSGAESGECHRYAPRPLAGGTGTGWTDWAWPSLATTESCGEHVKDDA